MKYKEVVIVHNCGFDEFYRVADIIKGLSIVFINKLEYTKAAYYDFNYNGVELVLHYNTSLGVTIHPRNLEDASELDNQMVESLATTIIRLLSINKTKKGGIYTPFQYFVYDYRPIGLRI